MAISFSDFQTKNELKELLPLFIFSMFIFVYFFTQTDPTRTVQRSAFCNSRRELSNAYFIAKFGFDPAENEPFKVR